MHAPRAEALATLQRGTRSSSAHYLIASRDHLALGVEATPGGFADLHLTHPDHRGIVVHTNHFAHPRFDRVDVGAWLMPDSLLRLQRADRWLDRHDPFAPSTYEALLSDHAGHPTGVCCHPDLSASAPEQDSTVLSVVMDLGTMTMRLADGRPCETGYRTLDYAGFLSGRAGVRVGYLRGRFVRTRRLTRTGVPSKPNSSRSRRSMKRR